MNETPLPDLLPAFEAANLIDVAYTFEDSPVGRLLLASTPRGLVRVAYLSTTDEEALLVDLAARVSPRVLEAPRRLDPVRRELDEFFAGERREFEIPLDWQLVKGFGVPVLQATARIPYGQLSTYGQIAAQAGNPKAFRAAGTALGRNPLPIIVPCHRVLAAGGGFGGYTGGIDRKQTLLEIEGAR
jgi:methylated-DNA-[protein]-cysteine S-methyltransferase